MTSTRLLLAPLVLASLAGGCGSASVSVPPSAVAVVGDRTITRAQLSAAMTQARQSYAAEGRSFPAVGTAGYRALRHLAVGVLVEQAELEQEAPRLGVRVDEAQVEERLERMKEYSFGGDEQRYRLRLRAARLTDAEVRAAIRAQLLVQSMRQALTAGVTVTPAAVERYYEQHLADYSTRPSRIIRHILVRTRATAARLERRLRAGASFAALARRFSADPRTRGRGGRLTLVAGRTSPTLDRVAFSLRTGAASPPFHTRFGWELVQAVSETRRGRTTPLAQVRAAIQRRLLGERRNEVFDRWLASMSARYRNRTAYAPGFAPAAG